MKRPYHIGQYIQNFMNKRTIPVSIFQWFKDNKEIMLKPQKSIVKKVKYYYVKFRSMGFLRVILILKTDGETLLLLTDLNLKLSARKRMRDWVVDIGMESTSFNANERKFKVHFSMISMKYWRPTIGIVSHENRNELLPRVTSYALKVLHIWVKVSIGWQKSYSKQNKILVFRPQKCVNLEQIYNVFESNECDCNIFHAVLPLNRRMKGMSMRIE